MSPSLTVADDNLFGLKVILEGGVRSPFTEHFPFDLGNEAMRQAKRYLPHALANFARLSVEFMPESATNIDRPRFQPRRSARTLADGGNIGGIAGQNPTPYRNAVAGDGQCDHHLRAPVPLFGVSESLLDSHVSRQADRSCGILGCCQ